jgi:pimeloyl-ACP methyl ester carboxylesterase
MSTGNYHIEKFKSQLLQKSPLKTPVWRNMGVYTPPDFKKGESLPCVFFLPGFGSSPERWSSKDFPMYRLMDYLILAGILPRAMLVCLDGSTILGGSQYVDSVLNGPFSQHIADELIPYIEHHCGAQGPHALCGHSSGGMGALHLASLYPNMFRSVASFGGDMYFELTHKNMLAELVNDRRLGKLGTSMGDCLAHQTVHYVLALCAAYSPNLLQKTWMVDFPIDFETLEIQPEIWKKWLNFDPLCWKNSRLQKLKKLDVVYLSAGLQDQYQLHLGAEAFVHRGQACGVTCKYEAFEGSHSLGFQQMEAGLKALLL